LGVLNGALFRIGDVFIDTEMVLTWFLAQLGASNPLIGLVSPIRFGGSFLLQMLASGYIERKPYKLPFYRNISFFRCAALLLFALLVALVPPENPWLIVGFFVVLTFFSLGAGLVGIPFMDVVGKVVPPRRRGAFFGQRMFWGGLLALGGSSVVGFLLAEPDGLHFPLNVSVLFVLASVFFGLTAWSWVAVEEPPSTITATRQQGLRAQFGRGVTLLRENKPYRRYVLVRLALTVAGWAGPFYVVYAQRELGIPAAMLGFYLSARAVAGILSNLVWAKMSDRGGNRQLIISTTAVGLAVPVIALVVGGLNRGVSGASGWFGYAFAAVFLAAGVFRAGSGIGITNYLLDIAPDEQRSFYLAFNNTLFGLARFTGMASGLLADVVGFRGLIAMSAVCYAVALALALLMAEPRADAAQSFA
jgi:MFS family permease